VAYRYNTFRSPEGGAANRFYPLNIIIVILIVSRFFVLGQYIYMLFGFPFPHVVGTIPKYPGGALEVYPIYKSIQKSRLKLLIYGIAWYLTLFSILITATMLLLLPIAVLGYAWHIALEEVSNPFSALTFIALGFALYGLRSKSPFIYGISEVFVGITAIWLSVRPPTISPLSDIGNGVWQLVTILGGVYIIVRGLDNMDKKVPTRLQRYWSLLRWQTQ
jgi:hypothetical protein